MPGAHRTAILAALALVSLIVACGGGEDASSRAMKPANDARSAVETFADRAVAEFTGRGAGVFFDTGVLSYCRMNVGFDEGLFKALGYSAATAPRDLDLCYNVSGDGKKVALGATSSRGGKTACVILNATGATVARTAVAEVDRCLP